MKEENKIEAKMDATYRANWLFFNRMIEGVDLVEGQLYGMFSNLTKRELEVWIEETKKRYSEATRISTAKGMANFYAQCH